MGVNRYPDRILAWSLEGRNREEIPIMKWEWEVERAVKQNTQYTGQYCEKRLRNDNRNTGTHMVVEYYYCCCCYPFFFFHGHVTWIFLKF
jgi:hypothetical protein